MLTDTFTKVIQEIEFLSDIEQNDLATLLSEELKWTKTFVNSQELLSTLAKIAISEHKDNLTQEVVCE